MLYKTLKKLVLAEGLTEELREKIDLFFSLGRITEEQYKDLIGE